MTKLCDNTKTKNNSCRPKKPKLANSIGLATIRQERDDLQPVLEILGIAIRGSQDVSAKPING